MQLIQYQPDDRESLEATAADHSALHQQVLHPRPAAREFVRQILRWIRDMRVFLISWVNPGPEQRDTTWDDYIESGVLTAIKVIKKITAAKKVNAVAWCVGGTLLASVLAVMHARKTRPIASATFLTTLLDFSEPGELGVFIDDTVVEEREEARTDRNIPWQRPCLGLFSAAGQRFDLVVCRQQLPEGKDSTAF